MESPIFGTVRHIVSDAVNGGYSCMVFKDYVILGSDRKLLGDFRNAFYKLIPGSGDFKLVDYAGAPRKEQIEFAIGNYGYWGLGRDGNGNAVSLEMWKFDPSKFK
jgi:hypothetical protein